MATIELADRHQVHPIGRDEMNLAEFPIALLSSRGKNEKTIVYEGKGGKLTISGTDKFGLPTALDQDVIIGLLQLTKRSNNFTEPTVNFTRYELLKIIRWPNESKYYNRLVESLNRWAGVKLYYENCWWDNKKKTRVNAAVGLLESFTTYDRTGNTSREFDAKQEALPLSTFTWNKAFFRSCQDNNLKKLDLDVYFSFQSSITKQLYRLLDKRFYQSPIQTFELNEFAFFHIGLSSNYSTAKIKEKLAKPLAELEEINFIEAESADQRYKKLKQGEWTITLKKKVTLEETIRLATVEPAPMTQELIARGVTASTAEDLAETYPIEQIKIKLEAFDWLVRRQDKRVEKSPAGYLVKSIQQNYAAPKGFKSKADIVRETENKRQVELRRQESLKTQREEAAREADENKQSIEKIEAHLASLDPEDRAQLEKTALLEGGFKGFFRAELIQRHVGQLLGLYPEA